jgi:hypothetical protein
MVVFVFFFFFFFFTLDHRRNTLQVCNPIGRLGGILQFYFFFLMKDLSVSFIKDYEHKVLPSQSIKLCKNLNIKKTL